jgi:hypothetical protein
MEHLPDESTVCKPGTTSWEDLLFEEMRHYVWLEIVKMTLLLYYAPPF